MSPQTIKEINVTEPEKDGRTSGVDEERRSNIRSSFQDGCHSQTGGWSSASYPGSAVKTQTSPVAVNKCHIQGRKKSPGAERKSPSLILSGDKGFTTASTTHTDMATLGNTCNSGGLRDRETENIDFGEKCRLVRGPRFPLPTSRAGLPEIPRHVTEGLSTFRMPGP